MSEKSKYALNVLGCWAHAALLTFGAWVSPINAWGGIGLIPIVWAVGLAVWPLWVYSFWRGGERRLWGIIGPMLGGVLLMVPGFFLILVLYAMNHAKTI